MSNMGLGSTVPDPIVRAATRTDHAAVSGITRDEWQRRAIDMGGQYYARQNSAFVPNSTDPVSGSGTKY